MVVVVVIVVAAAAAVVTRRSDFRRVVTAASPIRHRVKPTTINYFSWSSVCSPRNFHQAGGSRGLHAQSDGCWCCFGSLCDAAVGSDSSLAAVEVCDGDDDGEDGGGAEGKEGDLHVFQHFSL